jgi:hypothetical protein
LRALARQKENRFATAEAVRTTIEAIAATPPSPTLPPAAAGYPVLLSGRMAQILIGGFVALTGFFVYQLSFSRLLFSLWARFESDWREAVLIPVGLAGVGWLALAAWRRREWFLAPLQQQSLWLGRDAGPWESAKVTEWLRVSCLAFTAALSLDVLLLLITQVQMLAQAASARSALAALSVLLPLGAVLSPSVLGVVLVIILVRRELRRQDTSPAGSPPAWLARGALLFVLFSLVTSAPMLRRDVPVAVSFGGISAVGAIALLTRSRIWRALSLAVLVQSLVISSVGLFSFARMAGAGELPPEWKQSVGPVTVAALAMIVQSLSLVCYAAGLILLLAPATRSAFGLQPRTVAAPTELRPAQ